MWQCWSEWRQEQSRRSVANTKGKCDHVCFKKLRYGISLYNTGGSNKGEWGGGGVGDNLNK